MKNTQITYCTQNISTCSFQQLIPFKSLNSKPFISFNCILFYVVISVTISFIIQLSPFCNQGCATEQFYLMINHLNRIRLSLFCEQASSLTKSIATTFAYNNFVSHFLTIYVIPFISTFLFNLSYYTTNFVFHSIDKKQPDYISII